MKTFIDSVNFLEIIYLMLKITFPRNLSVPRSLLTKIFPRKIKILVDKTRNADTSIAHVLKIKSMLKYLPEQVPMASTNINKKC